MSFAAWHENMLQHEAQRIASARAETFDADRTDHWYDAVTSDDRASEHIESLIVALRRRQYVSPQQLADLTDAIDDAIDAAIERKEALTR